MGVTGEEDTEQVEKPRAGAEHRRGAKEERKRKNEESEILEARVGVDCRVVLDKSYRDKMQWISLSR